MRKFAVPAWCVVLLSSTFFSCGLGKKPDVQEPVAKLDQGTRAPQPSPAPVVPPRDAASFSCSFGVEPAPGHALSLSVLFRRFCVDAQRTEDSIENATLAET